MTGLAAALAAGTAPAQVVFDGSLGTPGAAPTDPGSGFVVVEEGRGQTVASGGRSHLFHSFSQFDVGANDTVEFQTADGIDTILSRITDSGPSTVAGDLRVRSATGIGAPDVFLLNPNGILFNGSTRLDLAGAFVASTAQAVRFADGATFSTVDTAAPLPTTAAMPEALVFGSGTAGEIDFDVARVQTFSGSDREKAVSLTFVGRTVRATGLGGVIADDATVQIAAAGSAAVEIPLDLTAVAARGEATGAIRLDGDASTFSIQTNSTLPDQGRVVIRGGELVMRNAQILSGGDGAQGAETVAVDLGLGGALTLEGSSTRIDSRSSAVSGPGGIRIEAARVEVGAGASIGLTQNNAAPGSGRLSLVADDITLDGAFAEIKTTVNGDGDGGGIDIETERLTMTNDARILSEVLSGASGAGGPIHIDANEAQLTGLADILSVTALGSLGDGGAIDFEGQSLSVDEFSRVLAGSAGAGAGGAIAIDFDSVDLGEGAFIATGPLFNPQSDERFTGAAGALDVTATNLVLRRGAQISTTTDGDGDAGDLTLRVRDQLLIEGTLPGTNRASGLFARSGLGTGSTATGQGGAIDLEAAHLELRDGGQIGVESLGEGNAGAAHLRVGMLTLSGGSDISGLATGLGTTGLIEIDAAQDIRLTGGSTIQSTVLIPPGAATPPAPVGAGDITIRAAGRILLSDSEISTQSARTDSGNLSLIAGRALAAVDSEILTTVNSASGQGGDITTNAPVLAVSGGGIRANATGTNGAAGNVTALSSAGIVLVGGGVIEARADRGVAGDVILAGPETNLAGELSGLSAQPQNAHDSVRDPCAARATQAGLFEIVPETTPAKPQTASDPSGLTAPRCGRR